MLVFYDEAWRGSKASERASMCVMMNILGWYRMALDGMGFESRL
jgi:hypothetical protein